MTTQNLYNTMPDPMSYQFMEFLTQNNVVEYASEQFLGIQNCKYGKDHLTFFSYEPVKYFHQLSSEALDTMKAINLHYEQYFLYINNDINRTIPRFHFHLVKNRDSLQNVFFTSIYT